jgi:hypothetical protein
MPRTARLQSRPGLSRLSTAIPSACPGQMHAIIMSRAGREGHMAPPLNPEDRAASGFAAMRVAGRQALRAWSPATDR